MRKTRFSKASCESRGVTWTEADGINRAVDSLRGELRETIDKAGPLAQSKIAWKLATLRQSVTYRLMDLAESTIENWNSGNLLASVVLARSFFETVALFHFVLLRMERTYVDKDLNGLDALSMQVLFGSKMEELRLDNGYQSINVLTAIDLLAKDFEPARDLYERMSEISHPNAFGMSQFYATTDYATATVSFSRFKRSYSAIFSHIACSLGFCEWSVQQLRRSDEIIAKIAELHYRTLTQKK